MVLLYPLIHQQLLLPRLNTPLLVVLLLQLHMPLLLPTLLLLQPFLTLLPQS